MKLVYFYIRNWAARGLHNVEYGMDSNDVFHLRGECLTYRQNHVVPKDFWSLSSRDMYVGEESGDDDMRGVVDSISAIIGENGSGKTTFAAALGRCFQGGRTGPTYICITKHGDKFSSYDNLEGSIDFSEVFTALGKDRFEVRRERDGWIPHGFPFQVVYYSPFCAANSVWSDEQNNRIDLSITKYFSDFKANTDGDSPLHGFDAYSRDLVFTFARVFCRTVDNQRLPIPFPVPRYVRIGGTYEAMLDSRGTVVGALRGNLLNVAWDEQFIKDMCKMFCLADIPRFRVNMLTDFAGIIFQEAYSKDKSLKTLWDSMAWRELVGLLNRIVDRIRLKTPPQGEQEICKPLEREWRMMDDSEKNALDDFIGQEIDSAALSFADDAFVHWGELKRLWHVIKSLSEVPGVMDETEPRSIQIPLGSSEAFGLFLTFMHEENSKSRTCGGFQFVIPDISSGEWAYLTFWGRLYEWFTVKDRTIDPDSEKHYFPSAEKLQVLLFLDEAETTLHADWQRQLVKSLIWFVETFTHNTSVHAIFASHSPMLVSDIPSGNVVFIGGDHAGKTFAANIFDLYRDSFFMHDGTVGAFARLKLDALMKKISCIIQGNKSDKLSAEEWKIADLVCDPQAQRYFESVKPLVENVQGEKLT